MCIYDEVTVGKAPNPSEDLVRHRSRREGARDTLRVKLAWVQGSREKKVATRKNQIQGSSVSEGSAKRLGLFRRKMQVECACDIGKVAE